MVRVSETRSGLTVVENGPLVTPPERQLVVVTEPEPPVQPILGPNGQPISTSNS